MERKTTKTERPLVAPRVAAWGELVAAYQDSRKTVWAPKTVAVRSWHLRLFLEFAAEHGPNDPRRLKDTDVIAFHQRLLWKPGMRGRMLARSSVYHALKTLSLFFRWAYSQEHLLFDPMAELSLGKPQHPFPRVPTVGEMKELLAVPELSTPRGLRDRAILEVLYVLGLRRRECYNLDLTDVNLSRGQLAVRCGKLRKDRLLPMSDGLTKTLNRYLRKGRPGLRPLRTEPALFVSPASGKRLHYESLRARVQKLGQQIGLALYPHALRHACATHLLEGGADIRYVQELLGHATVTSTQIYTKISPMELHQVFRMTHPRSGQSAQQGPDAESFANSERTNSERKKNE